MEDFLTSTSDFDITDHFNNSPDNSSNDDTSPESILYQIELVVVCIGFPVNLLAIVAVGFLARKDHGAPVFIINLLISDLIQLCCLAAWQLSGFHDIIDIIHSFGLMASVGFMVCISLERYLVVTKPLWYRFRRDIRMTVMVCVGVWTLPLIFVLPQTLNVDAQITETVFAIFLLLPLPLFIFFLVGTLKALSAARSVPDDEKRRIVAVLVAVLLIYMLLFLPSVIFSLVEQARNNWIFYEIVYTLICFSPLADLILYFFIRKGAIDKLLKSLCCCKMSHSQETSSSDKENMSTLWTEAV